MKHLSITLVFVLLACVLPINAQPSMDNSDCIVIEFTSSLNPRLENGFVITDISAIDSLNIANHANSFQYYDFTWTSRLKYILNIYFDPEYTFDVGNELQKYHLAAAGVSDYVGFIEKPSVEMIPGEYLYSEDVYHFEDTIWPIHNDNDDKRNWRIFRRLQNLNSSGYWEWCNVVAELWEQSWGPFNVTEVSEFDRPFPYKWAFHGHSSLWHHLEAYNNTYKAWDYSEGEGTISMILDLQGYWTQHPDLINRWLPGYQTNNNYPPQDEINTPSQYQAWWANAYHGTACAGALAASREETEETEISNLSSVGVAPRTMLIGRPGDVSYCLDYLRSHPELNITVVTASYAIHYNENTRRHFETMIYDMGITIVKSRGYNDNLSTAPRYGCLEGFIVVGDYRPDYRVMTYFHGDDNLPNINNINPYLYEVEINAPGWEIWVPTIYHTSESSFTEIGYGLTLGVATSMAGPQVAGVVALIKSKYPWMTPAQVERQIKMGAHHLDDMINANASFLPDTPPSFYGAGCLNAYGSLFLHGDFSRDFVFSNEANGTALIGRDFTLVNSSMVVENGILRIEKGATVSFDNSSLTLRDNVTVIFEEGSKLELYPTSVLNVGNNVTFQTENGETCFGLIKFGTNNQSIAFNNTHFANVPIEIYNTEISFNGCEFTRSNVMHVNESLAVDNCNFSFCGLQAINTISNSPASCSIRITPINNSPIAGIQVTGYGNVEIQANQLQYNFSGIELYECSRGIISDNYIAYNGNGILLYHTDADILGHNTIMYNSISSGYGDDRGGYGIDARHLSSWNLIGQRSQPIQIICENQREEILIQSNSIPTSMYFNKVYSSNHDSPNLRMWDTFFGTPGGINISNNNWSNDFEPSRDISPESAFTYLPIWEPGIPLQELEDEASLLFVEAMAASENLDYIVAEQKLKLIIELYPETKTCVDAAKQLLILVEKYNQNYESLELYYKTYPNLRNDPVLLKMADYLANFCKMKAEEYAEAIQFFEDMILNPPSFPDSLFAVIDAGYAYLLMAQNSNKSSYTGELKWLKPSSISAYLNRRNDLINNRLTSTAEEAQSSPSISNSVMVQNFPNPFNPNTTISFTLPEPGDVMLGIYNIKGQLVKTLINMRKDSGAHTVVWNGTDQSGRGVSSGVYFYRLSAGGKSFTRRMLLMK